MTSEQRIAYEALVNFELTGELPDWDTFQKCHDELIGCERRADRFRKLVDECHHNENLRHSRMNSSSGLSAADAADGSADYLPRSDNESS